MSLLASSYERTMSQLREAQEFEAAQQSRDGSEVLANVGELEELNPIRKFDVGNLFRCTELRHLCNPT